MKILLPIAVSLVFAGCGYAPEGFEENAPSIEASFPNRDQVVFGTSTLTKWSVDSNNNLDDVICTVEQDIVGWVEEEKDVIYAGCVGCAEMLTLSLATTEGANCHSVGGLPTLAILDFELLQIVDPDLYEFEQDRVPPGADGPPVAFAAVDWIPSYGELDDFVPRAFLHLKLEDSGLDFAREYLLVSPYFYPDENGERINWSADLRLTD
jgi:hypothetical protein